VNALPERAAQDVKRQAEHEALRGRARELGFETLDGYLRDRYHRRNWRIVDVAAELRTNPTRVRKLLARYGIKTTRTSLPADPVARARRGQQQLAAADAALAEKRRREDDELARRLGFPTLAEWHADRVSRGWTQRNLMTPRIVGFQVRSDMLEQPGQLSLQVLGRREPQQVGVGRIEVAGRPFERGAAE